MQKKPMTRKAIATKKFGMPQPGRRAVSAMPKVARPARTAVRVPKKAVASARKMIASRRRAK